MLKKYLLYFVIFGCLGTNLLGQSDGAIGSKSKISTQSAKSDSLIEVYSKLPEDTLVIDSLLHSSIAFLFSEPKIALKLVKEAEVRTNAIKDKVRLAKVYMLIGLLYRGQSATELALQYLNRSLELAILTNEVKVQASIYNNIATIQGAEGDHVSAITYFKKARVLLLQTGEESTASVPLLNIAASYHKLGETELAIATYDTVLGELEVLGNFHGLSSAKNNLAEIYSEKGEYARARQTFLESEALKQEVNDQFGMCDLLNNLGVHFGRMNEVDSARIVLLKALEISLEIGARDKEFLCYKNLAENAEMRADWIASNRYFKQYDSLREAVSIDTRKDRKAKLMTAFDIQAKDSEIKLLQKDSELNHDRANYQRIIFGIALIGLGLFVVILIRSNRRQSIANRQLQKLNTQNEGQKAEILRKNEDLQSQNIRLADLNREMDGILHIVAHDLKAPLNQAAGLANLVELAGDLNEEQLKYLTMIAKVTENAGRLVQDLIEISRLEAEKEQIQLTSINAVEACSNVLSTFEGDANRKQIVLKLEAEQDSFLILSEENSLRRVLENLISNALKFSSVGSEVRLGLNQSNGKCLLEICDQGPGISKQDQKKLFQKFAKLSARPTGGEDSTGLGLAIVEALVQKLNGRVWVESKLGEGATFFVELPSA